MATTSKRTRCSQSAPFPIELREKVEKIFEPSPGSEATTATDNLVAAVEEFRRAHPELSEREICTSVVDVARVRLQPESLREAVRRKRKRNEVRQREDEALQAKAKSELPARQAKAEIELQVAFAQLASDATRDWLHVLYLATTDEELLLAERRLADAHAARRHSTTMAKARKMLEAISSEAPNRSAREVCRIVASQTPRTADDHELKHQSLRQALRRDRLKEEGRQDFALQVGVARFNQESSCDWLLLHYLTVVDEHFVANGVQAGAHAFAWDGSELAFQVGAARQQQALARSLAQDLYGCTGEPVACWLC